MTPVAPANFGSAANTNPAATMGVVDYEWVRQLRAGNDLAYRRLLEQYRTRVLRLVSRILGNSADPEDITQRVFVRVFLSVGSFACQSSLYTWIHRIAVNECYSILRNRRLTVQLEMHNDTGGLSGPIHPDPRPRADTVLLQRDYLKRLLEAIPHEDRRLLLLREIHGYSISQLARKVGINENSLKARLFRARQRAAKAAAHLQQHRNGRRPLPQPVDSL